MHNGIRIAGLQVTHMIGYLLSQHSGMFSARNRLLPGPFRQGEGDKPAGLGQVCGRIRPGLRRSRPRDADGHSERGAFADPFVADFKTWPAGRRAVFVADFKTWPAGRRAVIGSPCSGLHAALLDQLRFHP